MGTCYYVVDQYRRRVLEVGKMYWLPSGDEVTASGVVEAFVAYAADMLRYDKPEHVTEWETFAAGAIAAWIGAYTARIVTEHNGDAFDLQVWECTDDLKRDRVALIPGWSFYRLDESGAVLVPDGEQADWCVARCIPVL